MSFEPAGKTIDRRNALRMRSHALLAVLVALNTLGLFLTQLLVFFQFGANSVTDAFMASLTLPQALSSLIAVALTGVLIPHLSGESDKKQREDGWAVLTFLGLIFLVLSAVLSLGAAWWVPVVFHGFSVETQSLCIELTRIGVLSIVFSVASGVAVAIYQARNRFVLVAAITSLATFLTVAAIYVSLPAFGIVSVAWMLLLGAILQFLLLAPALGKPGPSVLKIDGLFDLWARARPMLIGNVYCRGEVLLDRYLLSTGTPGEMSLYSLARQILEGAAGIISKTLAGTVLPALSVYFKRQDLNAFRRVLWRRSAALSVVALLACITFLVGGEWLLRFLVGYGQMTVDSVGHLWWMMVLLGGVFFFGVVGSLSAIGFYAAGDTKTPTYLSVFSLTGFALVKVISYRYYGVEGLALATSLYFGTNFLLMVILLPAKRERGC